MRWDNARMTRDRAEAEQWVAQAIAGRGEVDKWGRMTSTLLGAEIHEFEFRGRPMFRVEYIAWTRDPLFDAGLPSHVRQAQQEFSARLA